MLNYVKWPATSSRALSSPKFLLLSGLPPLRSAAPARSVCSLPVVPPLLLAVCLSPFLRIRDCIVGPLPLPVPVLFTAALPWPAIQAKGRDCRSEYSIRYRTRSSGSHPPGHCLAPMRSSNNRRKMHRNYAQTASLSLAITSASSLPKPRAEQTILSPHLLRVGLDEAADLSSCVAALVNPRWIVTARLAHTHTQSLAYRAARATRPCATLAA
jgi:hypothetical protein